MFGNRKLGMHLEGNVPPIKYIFLNLVSLKCLIIEEVDTLRQKLSQF